MWASISWLKNIVEWLRRVLIKFYGQKEIRAHAAVFGEPLGMKHLFFPEGELGMVARAGP